MQGSLTNTTRRRRPVPLILFDSGKADRRRRRRLRAVRVVNRRVEGGVLCVRAFVRSLAGRFTIWRFIDCPGVYGRPGLHKCRRI